VLENFASADIIRASHEDFHNLFDIDDPEDAFRLIREYSGANLIYTHSSRYVYVAAGEFQNKYPVPKIDVVSTIGAGDNFNAGVIYAILQQDIVKYDLKSLDNAAWQKLEASGIRFSASVCQSWDNYVPEGLLKGK
jgi:fructokinase